MAMHSTEKTTSTACRPKRKAFMLPPFTDFRKDVLANLCGELGILTAGLRKEEMIDRLYQADNAAAFGHPTSVTSLGSDELLVACVKARVRSIRHGKNTDGLDFLGLSNDLPYLRSSSSNATGPQVVTTTTTVWPEAWLNVAMNPNLA